LAIEGKLYPDLRHNFLVALTSHARRSNKNAFQRASFDSALRSVVVIGLHTRPLRSAEAARRIKGVGSTFYDILKESVNGTKGNKPFAPAVGKYSCVAAAALVALLELEESNASIASANGQSFSMEELIRKINELLDQRANASLNQTASKYCQPTNLDPGWGQVKKLSSANAVTELGGPFIKGRTKKDSSASGRLYELLDSGREIARKLRALSRLGPAEDGPLRQYPEDTVDEEFGAVTVSMDFREGGGCGKGLHKICDQLDIRGVPYVVRELKIADFLFFNGDKLAPLLIERKTAEDVASSIHDGRWERQQRKMRQAQFVLGGGPGRRCKICYIIEGDPSKKTVHGGNVGRHTWFQSVEDVTQAIDKLPMLGFGVMRTKSNLDTIGLLAKIAADVSWNVKNGSMEPILTYKEFTTRVKALGEDIGDPPTPNASPSSYSPPWTQHQNPAPPVVWNTEHIPQPPHHNGNENDNFSPQSDNGQSTTQFSQGSKAPSRAETIHHDENSEEYRQLMKLSITELKERCKDRDEKISGKKNDLIVRLLKPRKPEILIMRARRNDYNPKVPSCNAALMVALLNHHVVGTPGLTKERLMVLAEETGVSTESMGGDGGFYDGWAGMKQLLSGDPALVRKEKGHKYSLTTQVSLFYICTFVLYQSN
jgi:ERCC4-type nuclease